MVKKMELENNFGIMDKHSMDNGLIIICMVMVNGYSLMEEKKKEFGLMEIELDG